MAEVPIVQAIREAIDATAVSTDPDTLTLLAQDALPSDRLPAGRKVIRPLCVVQPRSTEHVATVMRLANTMSCPVIPVGGGSGLMGGAASIVPGVVLDLRQLNAIHLRAADRMADVGAGVTIQALNEAASGAGLMCGHDPWTVAVATVGGTISTNSLGYIGGKYGAMGDQVLGLEAVMPTGEIVRTRAVEKSSTGLNLHSLFIGAEGCFGIITQATLRMFPMPQKRVFQAWEFAGFDTGFGAINALLDAGVRPSLLDFGDEDPGLDIISPAVLLVSYEGLNRVAQAEAKAAASLCQSHRGRLLPAREAEAFWQARHASGDAYAQARAEGKLWRRPRAHIDYLHVALPPSAVLDYRYQCLELLEAGGFTPHQTGLWDHAGLFSLVYSGGDVEDQSEIHQTLLQHCQDVDGAMEYCHGVGARLVGLMAREHGEGLEVMRRLKHCLDPNGILNPGKLSLSEIPPPSVA